jgi:methionyl-tRNA formyltransferase
MRVFIITQTEPVYAPVYLANIIQRTNHSIIGITALSPYGNKGWLNFLKQRMAMYGFWDFMKAASLYSYCRLMGLIPERKPKNRFYSVANLAAYYSVPLFNCSNINAEAYISKLIDLNIDILLSVASIQRFGRDLLDTPRMACLNVHSALLPKYRGIDGLFWALAHGESQVGVTVHLMNEGFDDGDIVGQQPFEVKSDDTLHRLYFRAMDVGATLISQVLDQFQENNVVKKPNNTDCGSYFSWPDREAARKFRKNGRRFF